MKREIGAALADMLTRRPDWTHERIARALTVTRPYITAILSGAQSVGAGRAWEIAELLDPTPEERRRVADAIQADHAAVMAAASERRAARRRRRRSGLDLVDGPAPTMTDARRAQVLGILKATGITPAEVRALLTMQNECSQAPALEAA